MESLDNKGNIYDEHNQENEDDHLTYDPIHNFHTEGVGEAKQNTNLLAIKGNTDLNERDQADFGICNENMIPKDHRQENCIQNSATSVQNKNEKIKCKFNDILTELIYKKVHK